MKGRFAVTFDSWLRSYGISDEEDDMEVEELCYDDDYDEHPDQQYF